jgi:nucleotide-binding universal stress UspA family protein
MTIIGNPVAVSLDHILFATDFSPSAETAKLYVEALGSRYASQVRILHVVNLSTTLAAPDAGPSIDIFRRFGEESLLQLRDEMVAKKIKVETELCEAFDPAAEILRIAQDNAVDVVVIGTRGHKGLARLVLGSTAEKVIHRAVRPVLTIGPAVARPKLPIDFQKIIYATDFSVEAANACVFALTFAEDFKGHLYLCHVAPEYEYPGQFDDRELNERFIGALQRLVPDVAQEWCEPECVLEHGYAADGILLLAERVQADLIVLGARKTSHWYDSLKSGVAMQVISASPCPVLTIRA